FSAAPRMPAEHILSATPGAGGMMVVSADPTQPMMVTSVPATPVVESAPTMANSGGADSQPGSPPPASATPTNPPPALPVRALRRTRASAAGAGCARPHVPRLAHPASRPPMPVQAITVQATGISPTMQQAAIPGTPVTTTMAIPATPIHGTGTPILMLIQGSN